MGLEVYYKFILSFALILVAAVIGGELAQRYLKQPAVLGELVAGILISPFALGRLFYDPIILNFATIEGAFGLGEFSVDLLGETLWSGVSGDTAWHALRLVLREDTYILSVDGVEVGRGLSYWRPRSLYLGNPVIVWHKGLWTEVAIDDLRLEVCDESMALPLIMQAWTYLKPTVAPEPTMTSTLEPTITITGTLSPTSSPTQTPPEPTIPPPSHRAPPLRSVSE